jgi:hypothetical protein
MTSPEFTYGYRIVGDPRERRRLVDWGAAFGGYAKCDHRAEVTSEGYLSAFTFNDDFRQHLEMRHTTKGYAGPCHASWLWFDIDREDDLDAATRDARRLCAATAERYRIDGDAFLIFFSGSKGFHVGVPSSLWQPEPTDDFHKRAARYAEQLAATARVVIDNGIYDRVRALRAPNSRHPKTGLFKRRLEFSELLDGTTAAITERAAQPQPFELPHAPPACAAAITDWRAAADSVQRQATAYQERRAMAAGVASLNRQTLEFIRHGATIGNRHRLAFSAAANLAEFNCPRELAHALLMEPAIDCGLPPSEARRQIDCGLSHLAGAMLSRQERVGRRRSDVKAKGRVFS